MSNVSPFEQRVVVGHVNGYNGSEMTSMILISCQTHSLQLSSTHQLKCSQQQRVLPGAVGNEQRIQDSHTPP